jgi:hypothetical protein
LKEVDEGFVDVASNVQSSEQTPLIEYDKNKKASKSGQKGNVVRVIT